MLKLVIPAAEYWDEGREMFINYPETILRLEHSLVSVSKWESRWNKAFLSRSEKTLEQTIDYIRCMTITQNVPEDVYDRLSVKNIEDVNAYIEAPMTATHICEQASGGYNSEQVTSELIYYWLISLGIPFECQKWHLNRLLTLIKVCSVKNRPPKKMSKGEISRRNAALNAARRKKYNTKG